MPRGKGKNNKPKSKCIDCGKELSRRDAKRCHKCSFIGINNPNYKHGRTFIKIKCKKCGKEIDNKRQKTGCCINCASKEYKTFSGKKHTKRTKKLIGQKSKEKFTKEYLTRVRKTFEERGLWVPKDKLSEYQLYYRESNWQESMLQYCSTKELNLFKQRGFFNKNTNTKGVVRDHKYSRYSGFQNDVPAIILRHPCNCQIILHSENVSKAHKGNRYTDNDSISLKQLINNIKNFKGQWKEQKKVIEMMNQYNKERGLQEVGGQI